MQGEQIRESLLNGKLICGMHVCSLCIAAGPRGTARQYDQGDDESVVRVHGEVLRRAGKADILVNNSVQATMRKRYVDTPSASMETVRVNAAGIFTMCRAFGDSTDKRGQYGSDGIYTQ